MSHTLPGDWSRWRTEVDLDSYDERWSRMAAAGQNPHGEADLVASYEPSAVLDGGCGTGRVAVELARRGMDVVGVDPDPDMIAAARAKAPSLRWLTLGLEDLELAARFDVVVLAGNVVPYVAPTDRAAAVAACARHLGPGGRLVAGFSLQGGWPTLADYDGWCAASGLSPEDRWSTWSRDAYTGGSYAVSVHRPL
ncbi:class I SAM-dependent methyltransferase [Pseudonocardia asaccharolytica]|uniref:class I SAM-dependent methyltransferase n=1 Tax=Pseudonocardia asaccharolytica TaxID=54010 RepID=UPI00048A6B51|nr:class I SAM-dependent methyltransferase [Pseudonocardia asaccharolytica]